MGAGTLSKANTIIPTQQNLIYNAWWFEAIHVFFMINFIGNIKRYQLLKKEKWAFIVPPSFILLF
jgi:hypothetical protein